MVEFYRTVMDSNKNPLRNLPPAQRFQGMAVLSMMWTAIFCAGAGIWMWYGEIVVLHVLLALGSLITAMTVQTANKAKTYRDHAAPHGTAGTTTSGTPVWFVRVAPTGK